MAFKPPPPAPKGLWRRTPPAVFPTILGLMGLALAWRRGAGEFGVPQGLAEMLVGAMSLLAVFALVAYLAKVVRRTGVVAEDLRVLPGRAGLATAAMTVYALAAAIGPFHNDAARLVLFCGFALHAALILMMLWLIRSRPGDPARPSPVWHLIFVGPVVGAVAAAGLGLEGLAAGIASVTAVVAVAIWGISAAQLSRETVPAPLRPLLAIHLAPAALHGQVALVLGYQGWMIACAALSVLILAGLVVSAKWLLQAGFSPLWGALTFPMAATASLWLGIGGVWRVPGGLLLVIATFFIGWVGLRVMKVWATGELALKTNAAVA